MDKAILIPLAIWALMAVVTAFKGSLNSSSRILAVIPVLFYVFIFKDDVLTIISSKKIPYQAIFKNTVEYAFVSLAIVWPVVLFFGQKLTDSDFSSLIIKMVIFSVFLTAGFIYFN
jgi:hypothetical protein